MKDKLCNLPVLDPENEDVIAVGECYGQYQRKLVHLCRTLNHSLTERTMLGHMPPMLFIQTCVFTVKIGKYLLDSLISKDDWVIMMWINSIRVGLEKNSCIAI